MKKSIIGFIGQGFIGKSYADDFAARGYTVVRYSPHQYAQNRVRIGTCDIVFIAVPTPSTPKGFDYSVVEDVLTLIGKGKIAVIKSTILPGTTKVLQKKFPDIYVMHSPEFLVLKTAARDAKHPLRNIIGPAKQNPAAIRAAHSVLRTLPKAPFSLICSAEEAELIKYAGNFNLYLRVLFANLIYEVAQTIGADYEVVRNAIAADPRIGPSHLAVVHDSGHQGARAGRGAGGVCFIKDVAALTEIYDKKVKEKHGSRLLHALIEKNLDLLVRSGKDLALVEGVHGTAAIARHRKKK
ncbi:hypothetical protein EXS62_02055 [Candidatus Kaiserbacteria bacterium]|nr:hypothetical protein [Candidatus Kaiserbacteria bacterium]